MDSEHDKQEALNLDDDGGFKDSESVDDPEDDEDKKPASKTSAPPGKDVKGEKLEN